MYMHVYPHSYTHTLHYAPAVSFRLSHILSCQLSLILSPLPRSTWQLLTDYSSPPVHHLPLQGGITSFMVLHLYQPGYQLQAKETAVCWFKQWWKLLEGFQHTESPASGNRQEQRKAMQLGPRVNSCYSGGSGWGTWCWVDTILTLKMDVTMLPCAPLPRCILGGCTWLAAR